jgi:hypothetical protein
MNHIYGLKTTRAGSGSGFGDEISGSATLVKGPFLCFLKSSPELKKMF